MTTSQKKTIIHTSTLLSSFVVFFFLLFLSTVYAEIKPYTPLVSIPGLTDQKMASLPDYLNKVYYLIITIGALYGVVKIAFAGVKYSLSDVITSKESAKEDIKGVLLGLAILLIPFIVLQTINPNLTRLDVFSSVKNKINLTSGSAVRSDGYNTAVDSVTSGQNKMSSCTSNSGSQWDYTCGKCILKTEKPGAVCGKEKLEVSAGYSCATLVQNDPQHRPCQELCTLMRGSYSSNTNACVLSGTQQ